LCKTGDIVVSLNKNIVEIGVFVFYFHIIVFEIDVFTAVFGIKIFKFGVFLLNVV